MAGLVFATFARAAPEILPAHSSELSRGQPGVHGTLLYEHKVAHASAEDVVAHASAEDVVAHASTEDAVAHASAAHEAARASAGQYIKARKHRRYIGPDVFSYPDDCDCSSTKAETCRGSGDGSMCWGHCCRQLAQKISDATRPSAGYALDISEAARVSLARAASGYDDQFDDDDSAPPEEHVPFDDSACSRWTGLPESDADAEPPMECGVLWYLHVPKTGGTTMSHYFESQHELHGWQYANMWKLPVPRNERGELHDPVVWTGWNTSAQWQVALDALAADKPKLIVHSHHNMPGLSEPYMVEQVLRPMARSLKQKGCDLRFATMLREPVAEVTSLLLFGKTPKEKFTSKMLKWTDAMAKYVVWNYYAQWPEELSKEGAVTRAQGEELLAQSRAVLSKCGAASRTVALTSCAAAVSAAISRRALSAVAASP